MKINYKKLQKKLKIKGIYVGTEKGIFIIGLILIYLSYLTYLLVIMEV